MVLLDANGTKSYAEQHIPGALDFAAVKDDLAKNLPADKGALIVAYCGSEKCMAYKAAAEAAAKLGYTNIKHYAPGIQGWLKSKEKVEPARLGKESVLRALAGLSSVARAAVVC